MLSNRTIELINKALDLSIVNAMLQETVNEYKKAKHEFNEYVYNLEDLNDNEE